MKVIRPSCEKFRAECPICFAYLEYHTVEIQQEYVKCPCCGCWFKHPVYARPVRESEDTE